jgi:DNA-binding NarL/FixJ family response regulator
MIKLYDARALSLRESEVTDLVTKGLSNKAIAEALSIQVRTVKFHLTSIYKKAGVKSRVQLIIQAHTHAHVPTALSTVSGKE